MFLVLRMEEGGHKLRNVEICGNWKKLGNGLPVEPPEKNAADFISPGSPESDF